MNIPADLRSRIGKMDLKRPYVWQLRISAGEFAALEEAVREGGTTALEDVVYLAEWYKRRYDGGTAKPVRDFNYQAIFEASGIAHEGNLFETEGGIKTWRYSIYVLGGLAFKFEQGNDRLLRELCRIFYGEDGDIDKLRDKIGDKDRAIAFKESVRSGGSLYAYLKETLGGNPPFAADDLENADSPENAFLERIKTANDAILKSKFDLEWLIRCNADSDFMVRSLRLVMKPESLGGINHEYLAFDRVRRWGIEHPETCRFLKVAVRFLKGDRTVAEPDFGNSLVEYSTTGRREAGFLAWVPDRFSRTIVAPVEPFDLVQIVVREEDGAEHVVETFKVWEWMQVFRVPEAYDLWTSRHFTQRESALVTTGQITMLEVGASETISRKPFKTKEGYGEPHLWRPIYDKVSFKDVAGKVITLFNRQGYDQIVTRLHSDTLCYTEGRISYTDNTDDTGDEELLPLVFGRDDIIVRHFESRNDLGDGAFTEVDLGPVEFRKGREYCEWTDTAPLPQGRVTLRFTVKGVERKLTVYHFPGEIRRDCAKGEIVCGDEVIADEIIRNGEPTTECLLKRVGTEETYADLRIWRATNHKEFVRHGRVVHYAEAGEEVEISYALRKGLVIRDFSEEGFREYDCGDIGGIYGLETFNPKLGLNLGAYQTGFKVNVAEKLDGLAPKWLFVNLAKKFEKTDAEKIFRWNGFEAGMPAEVGAGYGPKMNEVVFHGLKGYEGLNALACPPAKDDPWAESSGDPEGDLVKWFETATEQGVYYFIAAELLPKNGDLLKDLKKRLVKAHEGGVPTKFVQGLCRFAEEMGYGRSDVFDGQD